MRTCRGLLSNPIGKKKKKKKQTTFSFGETFTSIYTSKFKNVIKKYLFTILKVIGIIGEINYNTQKEYN